jgi:nucleotide-binding universal stress UspA family protein
MTESSGAGADPGERRTHPVLAGYDGSEPSRNALAYAAGMARRLDRHLIVVYVTQTQIAAAGGSPFLPIAVLRGHAADELNWLCRELTEVADVTGLRVEVVARDGDPARELASAAAEANADAIVIGAPAHLFHRLAGSVPAWLARHARCPVVIVP